jgi:uncharacterized delta-60 repeat protein
MIILPNMKSSIYKIRTLPFKILAVGIFTTYNGTTRNRIIRLNSDGTLDTGFTIGTGFSAAVRSIVVQSDGKIVVCGDISITRLNSNGALDTSFNNGNDGFDGATVNTLAIQSDGKIIAGGSFEEYNKDAQNRITRINPDGSRDTSFTTGTGFGNTVRAIAIQSDGKIITGGNFVGYNGTTQNRITRLNSNGTRDTGFTIGTGFNNVTYSIAIQSDGKIIIGGVFTSYNGTAQNRITRLNSDGTRDTSFTIGTGFSSGIVNAIAIQADGKIIAGGSFTNYDGTTQNRITRLNSDGTRDTSFTIGTGIAGTVNTIAIQSDGKIIIGGNFTFYDGTAQNYITRLNSDGTRDTSFVIGTGFNLEIYAIVIT